MCSVCTHVGTSAQTRRQGANGYVVLGPERREPELGLHYIICLLGEGGCCQQRGSHIHILYAQKAAETAILEDDKNVSATATPMSLPTSGETQQSLLPNWGKVINSAWHISHTVNKQFARKERTNKIK